MRSRGMGEYQGRLRFSVHVLAPDVRPLDANAKPQAAYTRLELLRIQLLEDFRDALGVAAGFADFVGGGDLASLVDDKCPAFYGHAAVGAAFFLLLVDGRRLAAVFDRHAEKLGDFAFVVGQEGEGKLVIRLEKLVGRNRIAADADDEGAAVIEVFHL